MPSEDVRSATHASAHLIGLVVLISVTRTIMSTRPGPAFDLMSRTSTLFFPFHNTQPSLDAGSAWLLTGLHWLAVAVIIGAMVRPIPRLRMTLATLLAILASGLGIELVLSVLGYAPQYSMLAF